MQQSFSIVSFQCPFQRRSIQSSLSSGTSSATRGKFLTFAYATSDSLRSSKAKMLLCSKGTPHRLPHSDVLSCKQCHHASCFFHLLEKCRLHSIYILLDRDKDVQKSHRSHHTRHKQGPKEYDTHLPKYMFDERSANRPGNFEIQMVNLALSFPKCRPINFSSTHAGWYDSIIIAPVVIRVGYIVYKNTTQLLIPYLLVWHSPKIHGVS